MAKANTRVRKKVKKNVAEGIAHIHASFNNTIVSITDHKGQVISWSSAGKCNFRGSRKSTAYAAQIAATVAMSGNWENAYSLLKPLVREGCDDMQLCLEFAHGDAVGHVEAVGDGQVQYMNDTAVHPKHSRFAVAVERGLVGPDRVAQPRQQLEAVRLVAEQRLHDMDVALDEAGQDQRLAGVDRARLREGELALSPLAGLIVIDEIQRQPELFSLLRVLADRRPARARFLILGSASPDLVKGVSETLAGRVAFVDMGGATTDVYSWADGAPTASCSTCRTCGGASSLPSVFWWPSASWPTCRCPASKSSWPTTARC